MSDKRLPLLFAVLKTVLHLFTAQNFGFHRDELLYLSLGRHLDWGFWSNPPFIGFISWLTQHTLGDSVLAIRCIPAMAGGALVWLVLRMVQEMGGGKWAVLISAAGMFGSIAWLRAFSMLQPVPFDIFFWTLTIFFVLRWINTRDERWWWAIGASIGLGMLNKYMLLFLGAAAIPALLFTRDRQVFLTKGPWIAVFTAVVITIPNIWWQWKNHFPVWSHMQELKATQLDHVEPLQFLLDQLLFHGPGVLLWGAGLIWLLGSKSSTRYRFMGWYFVAVILLFLLLHGKSYYTIGAYPVLFAAGGVCWEKILQARWLRVSFAALIFLLPLPLLPYGLPLLPPEQLARYYQKVKIESALRCEEGHIHELPQDFSDMLGWEEIGDLTEKAIHIAGGTDSLIVYGENYGQAAAADYFSLKNRHLEAISFSDSYRLWAPHTLSSRISTLIYINDELGEDIQGLFSDIQLTGSISHPLARETGTSVWLCRKPVRSFQDFWQERTIDLPSKK